MRQFGLGQELFHPQRDVFLLPHFLRQCLAFKNKILVDSFLESDEQLTSVTGSWDKIAFLQTRPLKHNYTQKMASLTFRTIFLKCWS